MGIFCDLFCQVPRFLGAIPGAIGSIPHVVEAVPYVVTHEVPKMVGNAVNAVIFVTQEVPRVLSGLCENQAAELASETESLLQLLREIRELNQREAEQLARVRVIFASATSMGVRNSVQ